ncbi:hypothetical protein QEN19_000407 [Hanseniaspora menglaensis]
MKKSTPHKVNGLVLENIFKKGKDIVIYNEEHLSKTAINSIVISAQRRKQDGYQATQQALQTTATIASTQSGEKVNKPFIATSEKLQGLHNNQQNAKSLKNSRSNISENQNIKSINLDVLPETIITKNTSKRSLAKSSSFTSQSNLDSNESHIKIYKDLVKILEKKCSILEATSLSQDDKVLRLQNIEKVISIKKRLLNQQSDGIASNFNGEKSTMPSNKIYLPEVRDDFIDAFGNNYAEKSSDYSSDDDSLVIAATRELQRKETLKTNDSPIVISNLNDNHDDYENQEFDDYQHQEFDDFDNNTNTLHPILPNKTPAVEVKNYTSLSNQAVNRSDLTDEAEAEDSHYFSSSKEYSEHQSDVDFVEGENSFINGNDSYHPGVSESSQSSLFNTSNDISTKNNNTAASPKTKLKPKVSNETMELINFDDMLVSDNKQADHVVLSEESDDEVIELSSDYDAERETYSNSNNMENIDNDLELSFSQSKHNENVKNEIKTKFNFKVEQLSDDDSDDDELEALVFNQIDKSKSNLQPNQHRLAGDKRYPWTDELEHNLQQKFKLKSFRSNQLDAINAILNGDDVFVLMPTGGGKSLCYQLPATVNQGKDSTTIVVSPLISLMQDQVEHLRALHINAAMISSKDSSEARRDSFRMFRAGHLDLIYLSPEMLSKSEQCKSTIKKLYEEGQLARIIIDEAHCVSSWGHDFRPDYKLLSFFKRQYPDIPMMALTATASVKVRTDIINNLGLKNALMFKQSFNRPNLIYMVRPKNKDSMFEMITEISTKFRSKTGIVYCNSKKQCEDTSRLLVSNGLSCAFYHAGMENEDRSEVQMKWQSSEIKIVCATVAFGMGIDKPDVRFVYHHTMPRSLEGYYQECGRGGRDGKTSFCTMYYQYADFKSLESQIKRDKSLTNKVLKQRHLEKLHDVLNYCSNTIECRRKLVLQYFNENFNVALCKKTCDNCKASNEVENRDVSEDAKVLLSIVEKIGYEDVTANYIIDVYRGSQQQKIVQSGHALLEEHGKGSKYLKEDVQRMIQLLLDKGFLKEKTGTNSFGFANTYVKFGKRLSSKLIMTFSISKSISAKPSRPSSPYFSGSRPNSESLISDVLANNVQLNKDDLKKFNEKKRSMEKSQSSTKKRSYAKQYRRSRRG